IYSRLPLARTVVSDTTLFRSPLARPILHPAWPGSQPSRGSPAKLARVKILVDGNQQRCDVSDEAGHEEWAWPFSKAHIGRNSWRDRKSRRLNYSHQINSYAVF